METYQAAGAVVGRPHHLTLLPEAYANARQANVGLAWLTEALTMVGQTGERSDEAEVHRLMGELLLGRFGDHHAPAEVCFQQTLEVACQQQAKAPELRAP
jgi:hypothetical protein